VLVTAGAAAVEVTFVEVAEVTALVGTATEEVATTSELVGTATEELATGVPAEPQAFKIAE
jgi:hypothetical protein